MLNALNQWILGVGASPYAVFVGLILAAIPIVAILLRWIWLGCKIVFEVLVKGFRNRWRREARKSVKRAKILVNESKYFEFFFRFIVYQITVVGIGLFYMVMILSISSLVSPMMIGQIATLPPSKIPILFALVFSVQLLLTIALKTRRFMRMARLRTRYVKRLPTDIREPSSL